AGGFRLLCTSWPAGLLPPGGGVGAGTATGAAGGAAAGIGCGAGATIDCGSGIPVDGTDRDAGAAAVGGVPPAGTGFISCRGELPKRSLFAGFAYPCGGTF